MKTPLELPNEFLDRNPEGKEQESLLNELYKVPAGKERILPVPEGQEGTEISPEIK